jgi:hypothetical protein
VSCELLNRKVRERWEVRGERRVAASLGGGPKMNCGETDQLEILVPSFHKKRKKINNRRAYVACTKVAQLRDPTSRLKFGEVVHCGRLSDGVVWVKSYR